MKRLKGLKEMAKTCRVCGKPFVHEKGASAQTICNTCAKELIPRVTNPERGICPICGTHFTPTHSDSMVYRKTCCDKCQRTFTALRQRIHKKTKTNVYSPYRTVKKSSGMRIDEINRKAMERGMSYGKYTAMMRSEMHE